MSLLSSPFSQVVFCIRGKEEMLEFSFQNFCKKKEGKNPDHRFSSEGLVTGRRVRTENYSYCHSNNEKRKGRTKVWGPLTGPLMIIRTGGGQDKAREAQEEEPHPNEKNERRRRNLLWSFSGFLSDLK